MTTEKHQLERADELTHKYFHGGLVQTELDELGKIVMAQSAAILKRLDEMNKHTEKSRG